MGMTDFFQQQEGEKKAEVEYTTTTNPSLITPRVAPLKTPFTFSSREKEMSYLQGMFQSPPTYHELLPPEPRKEDPSMQIVPNSPLDRSLTAVFQNTEHSYLNDTAEPQETKP